MELTGESKANIEKALDAIKGIVEEERLLRQLLEIARRISMDAVQTPEFGRSYRGTEVQTSLILELRLTLREIDAQGEKESDQRKPTSRMEARRS